MPKVSCHSATLSCTLGSSPSNLKVTSNGSVTANGKLIATVDDYAAFANIPSFGACRRSSPPPPCVPAASKWQTSATSVTVERKNPLNERSSTNCSHGGRISITAPASKKENVP